MTKLPSTRVLIVIALMVLFLIFLIAILVITNLSFSVWEQLQHKPDWVLGGYLLGVVLISLVFGRFIWRLLLPKKKLSKSSDKLSGSADNMDAVAQRLEKMSQNLSSHQVPENPQAINSETQPLEKSVNDKQAVGKEPAEIDISLVNKWADEFDSSEEVMAIKVELQEYSRRKSQQTIYIGLFGDISSGKSSLIKALISNNSKAPEARANEPSIETSVIGGTTREICHYHWYLHGDDQEQHFILTDMPGLNEQFAELDILATEEVRRVHIVIYLCDGDLTATQLQELKALLLLHKPCIVAVNKSDRYNKEEQQLIIANIQHRLADIAPDVAIVAITAGGMREFIRLTPDGQEETIQREVPPDIDDLQQVIQTLQRQYGNEQLERLREKSVASMVNNKLDDLEARFRHSRSRRMVNSYTKKAVVASLATISPGTDILVQGYLGIQMIKDLCQLHGVSARDIDANKLIELIQLRMDKTMPLLLAIAGNGLKAFPGIGTVTGGLVHAVAYGMIFDTLGRSVARTLEVTGELSPVLVSDLYKEQLSENVQSRTKDFIKMVLKLRKSD